MTVPPSDDATDPAVTRPVTVGPVYAHSVGGVPMIGVTQTVAHLTGQRLSGLLNEALGKADLTIQLP